MKVLAKGLVLAIILPLVGCAQQRNKIESKPAIEKIIFTEWLSGWNIGSVWNIADGIKITNGDKIEYFLLGIDIPPCCQKGEAEIRVKHQSFTHDSLISEKRLSASIDSNRYPVYWINTLSIFNSSNRNGAYFFTMLENPLGGLDPRELVLWVYYNEMFYKFSGIVPLHQDWLWEKTYSFTPDERLKSASPEAYQKITDVWNEHIEKYKKQYNNN